MENSYNCEGNCCCGWRNCHCSCRTESRVSVEEGIVNWQGVNDKSKGWNGKFNQEGNSINSEEKKRIQNKKKNTHTGKEKERKWLQNDSPSFSLQIHRQRGESTERVGCNLQVNETRTLQYSKFCDSVNFNFIDFHSFLTTIHNEESFFIDTVG